MRLVKVQITNFRCIEDSRPFTVAQNTCLVGKNESGKTAVLNALYRLNPDLASDAPYDKERDYPRRHLSDYDVLHPDEDARVVETKWVLDETERAAIREVIGPDADGIDHVVLTKEYEAKTPTWTLSTKEGPLSEASIVAHLVKSSDLHAEEQAPLRDKATIKDLRESIEALGTGAGERHQALLKTLSTRFKKNSVTLAVADALQTRLPKFIYFSQYHGMRGRVALNALKKRETDQKLDHSDRTFLDFCAFAGSTLEELASIGKFESLVARFEAAQNKITEQIFEFWTQNQHLRVLFSRNEALKDDEAPFNQGYIFNVRIHNELHKASLPFDDRSAGFVWFFSFLVYFSQVQKRHGQNLVILLDEPGLALHAKAQADLLRFINTKLASKHQVIYTTHSPFMVPANDLLSVRTVEDVIVRRKGKPPLVRGTKVRSDVLKVDRDTLFPLQGALGYEISQSLFVGKHTLLVEGPSDLLYLKAFSEHLKANGRVHLDPRWTVCPVGGIEKVSAFISLFGGNKINVAALVDVATGKKATVKELERLTEVLRTGAILTTTKYAGQQEADIEDIVGRATYFGLVNETYGLKGEDRLSTATAAAGVRVVKVVEDHFRPRGDLVEFDHYRPAEHLLLNRVTLLPKLPSSEEALSRFESFFKDVNPLLNPPTA